MKQKAFDSTTSKNKCVSGVFPNTVIKSYSGIRHKGHYNVEQKRRQDWKNERNMEYFNWTEEQKHLYKKKMIKLERDKVTRTK